MQIDLSNLNDQQKELIFKLGLLKVTESIYESLDSVDKLQKNMTIMREKTGLKEDEIWECYEFLSNAVIAIGRPKVREGIGFKQRES